MPKGKTPTSGDEFIVKRKLNRIQIPTLDIRKQKMIIFQPMRKFTILTALVVSIIVLNLLPLGAEPTADPAWYDISFIELTPPGANLYDGSINTRGVTLSNINFARILSGLQLVPPAGYENLKVRFYTPGGIFRFVKMDDPTKFMDATIRLQHQNLPAQPVSSTVDYPIVASNTGSPPAETNLFMDITTLPSNSGQQWRGTYYFPLQIQILDIDGYVVAERTLQMMIFFRSQTTAVTPLTTFSVEQYLAADHIPVSYPFQSGLPVIEVGGVTFQSNEMYNKYRLMISPVGQTKFQFNHVNPLVGGVIRYRVTIPGRTILSYEEAFYFNLDYQGTIGYWYDFLKIGVRDVNYNNSNGPTGDYTSSIRIDLITF